MELSSSDSFDLRDLHLFRDPSETCESSAQQQKADDFRTRGRSERLPGGPCPRAINMEPQNPDCYRCSSGKAILLALAQHTGERGIPAQSQPRLDAKETVI